MQFKVTADEDGQRLDVVLTQRTQIKRAQVTLRIAANDVLINGSVPSKPGQKVRHNDRIEITIPPPPPSKAVPEDIPLRIVHEDEHLVVIHKPARMPVHPSPGHHSGTLVNALVFRYGNLAPEIQQSEDGPRPGIVHRLDMDTTGLIVVARTTEARDNLMKQFADRTAGRRYLAIVHGPRLEDEGTWNTLHGRHPRNRKRFSSRVREGRTAITHWTVLSRAKHVALIECRLQTGRTHQIRVHCSDHGHPIVSDAQYGGNRPIPGTLGIPFRKIKHQALHAYQLQFNHPQNGELCTFQSVPEQPMLHAIQETFGPLETLLSLEHVHAERVTAE